MADHIEVEGIRPYDGEWPLDIGAGFSTREWGWIKKYAGYLPGTLTDEAVTDQELLSVFALVALHRAGKFETRDFPEVWDRFLDAPPTANVRIHTGDEEQEDRETIPPESEPSLSGNMSTSGHGSGRSSETLRKPPNGSGTHDLDSSVSEVRTLAN